MYDFFSNSLPIIFNDFFKSVRNVHQYNSRLASRKSCYLHKIRTNYDKYNIRYLEAKLWNSIGDDLKSKNRSCFKRIMKRSISNNY